MFAVGATGTREGISSQQGNSILTWLAENHLDIESLHHGVCIGADQDINDIARSMNIWTIGHPPVKTDYMAVGCDVSEMLPAKEFLPRDRDIVNACSILLVAPLQLFIPKYYRGSGTWYTYNYALSVEVPTKIFWRDGSVE